MKTSQNQINTTNVHERSRREHREQGKKISKSVHDRSRCSHPEHANSHYMNSNKIVR